MSLSFQLASINLIAYISSTPQLRPESETEVLTISKPAKPNQLDTTPTTAIAIDAATSVDASTSTSTISVGSATALTVNTLAMAADVSTTTSTISVGSATSPTVNAPATVVGVTSAGGPAVVSATMIVGVDSATTPDTTAVSDNSATASAVNAPAATVESTSTTTPFDAKNANEAVVIVPTAEAPTTTTATALGSAAAASTAAAYTTAAASTAAASAAHVANPMDVDQPELSSTALAIQKTNDATEGGTGNFVTDSRSHFQTLAQASPAWVRLVEKWVEFEQRCSETGVSP